MKITEAAFKGFKLGEESAGKEGREFICKIMGNVLKMQTLSEIHDYCSRMIAKNSAVGGASNNEGGFARTYSGDDLPVGGMFGAFRGEPDPDHD